MSEPTSALTYRELIVSVAVKMGVAYYGADGDEAAQIPQDAHDRAVCEGHVNDGIRMFISDSPQNGWRWMRPIASVTYWGDVAVDSTVTVSSAYEPSDGTTLVTASEATFYATMALKTLVVTDVDSYEIDSYVSTTQVRLSGDKHWADSKTFSIASDGAFTLPKTFGGQYTGPLTFEAGTNTGATVQWTSEVEIRKLRESSTTETGDPRLAAIRRVTDHNRRWELVLYPTPEETNTVEFAHDMYFDALTDLDELHPAGYAFDECVKAACHAVMERDSEDSIAGLNDYYRKIQLSNAMKIDGRSAPRRLGYMGNRGGSRDIRMIRELQQRPTVTY